MPLTVWRLGQHSVPAGLMLARLLALALALTLLAIAPAQARPSHSVGPERVVTVMTQNLYQGTEFRHIQQLIGATPSFGEALAATTADYATYLATRFKDRAALIAAEIAKDKPALVGLQEVARASASSPRISTSLPLMG